MNPIIKYGNFVSGMMAQTGFSNHVAIGDEATVLHGRDRSPAKVAGIQFKKDGTAKAFLLQEYEWLIDFETEGYAKEIFWDKPKGQARLYKVTTHGKMKGTVKDAMIGKAEPFYDRSF